MSDPIDLRHLCRLRNIPGPEIQAEYATTTRQAFDRSDSTPVIIPTYNEANDLPLALVALAQSSVAIEPIVVDSQSPDGTADIARDMGATVLSINRGQMLGYKSGIEHVQQTRGASPLLITDADCIPQRHWVTTMTRMANLSAETGGIAFGTTVFINGPSRSTDLTRSIYALVGDGLRKVTERPARQRGSNCFIQLDRTGLITNRLLELEDHIFPCDILLDQAVFEVTGQRRSITNRQAVIIANGDRYTSLYDLFKTFIGEKTGRSSRIERYADHGFGTK